MLGNLIIATMAAALNLVPPPTDNGNPALPRISEKELGGKERYLLYAATDKPIYREGETAYFRVVMLNAADNTPLKDRSARVSVKVKDPKGAVVVQTSGTITNSTAGLKWTIPAGQAGGVYTATVTCPQLGTPETVRTFDVRAYRAPRLKTQIEFFREGYGPGDTVTASIHAGRAEGGIPAGAKVTVTARVDGKEIFRQEGLTIDKDGNCSAKFSLPEKIEIGDGVINFIIADGGVIEPATKTIPILLPNLNIAFFPEGGELVAGLPCRVYVQANRRDGKPADLEGEIIPSPLASYIPLLKTIHEGRGTFVFTPKAGTTYVLKLNKPSGIAKTFALPPVKTSGSVLHSTKDTYRYDEKIAMRVSATPDSGIDKVTICKREVELDSQPVAAGKEVAIALDPKDAEGVLIVTAWNKNGVPLAERLVYRQPKFTVTTTVKASGGPFIPGGKVKLEILTTDENGKPVEAVVGLTVTDDSVLEMIEKREQAPRLPVMVYLENEVKDLADAQVYLDAANPKASPALDLLLGTQGWRRFILVRYDEIKKEFPQQAQRALAENKPVHMVMRFRRDMGMIKRGVLPEAMVDNAVGRPLEPDSAPALLPAVAAQPPPPKFGNLLFLDGKVKAEAAQAAKPMMMFKEIADKDVMEQRFEPPVVVIREYAHQVRPNRKPNDRVDFSETLYWNAGIRTGARDGKATVEFALSDGVTSFRALADTFGNNGALGIGDALVKSVEPFYIEPKMPLTSTVGDVLELPVALVNSTDEAFPVAALTVRGEGLDIVQAANSGLAAQQRARRIVKIMPKKPGVYKLVFSASAGNYTDTNTRTLTVEPKGFPIVFNRGGLLDAEHPVSFQAVIPAGVDPGGMKVTAKVYPSPLANMEEALNALLRQPSGCFEQTSSTNYPLVMAQQYFTSHQGIAPDKIAKARKLLEDGYKKLSGFECKQKGYEWFGGDPGHEALTAYGLMEFADMNKVMPVDAEMVQRTRQWLLDRRDGQGGFKRNDRALDSFGRAPQPTTNAYVIWALLESGQDPKSLATEIEAVKKEALTSKDSYVVALAANILYLAGDRADAGKLAEKLVNAVAKDGHVGGAATSITCSGGDSLAIETTALAILAWLKDDTRWAAQTETSMPWLFARCKAGRFGSTQSTILVLKAINAYDASRAKPSRPGTVQLKIDGQPFGHPVAFDKDSKGVIELPDFATRMTPGTHTLELVMTGGSRMPFAVEIAYYADVPASSGNCLLTLSDSLSSAAVIEGDLVDLNVEIRVGDKDAPTPVAVIGIPAGLEVRHDRLKELVGAGRIDSYEVFGRNLVLYWRALRSGEKRRVPISFTAAIPGDYTGPASCAYLYYTDENKCWIPGLTIKIAPRSAK